MTQNRNKKVIVILLWISVLLSLSGCATSHLGGSSVLPQHGPDMASIYQTQGNFISDSGRLDQVRSQIPRTRYSRYELSHRRLRNRPHLASSDEPGVLPNPIIRIYVYPHFDGDDQNYIPGHLAYTKLYQKTHFALPGEPSVIAE